MSAGEEGPRLLTLDEAARALSVSRRTVDRLVRDEELRTIHLSPRMVRVEVVEIDRYLREHRDGGRRK